LWSFLYLEIVVVPVIGEKPELNLKSLVYPADFSICTHNAGLYAKLLALYFSASLLVAHAFTLSRSNGNVAVPDGGDLAADDKRAPTGRAALPWAIAATLVRPTEKVLSISGDDGFLFSAMELETAVLLKSNLVHVVLIDNSCNMTAEQALIKHGRASGTDLGPVDPVKYAEAFGAKGFMIESPEQITPCCRRPSIY
jgi:Thiamine pyrophosphate enzyme, C-terminal TPP binding domain